MNTKALTDMIYKGLIFFVVLISIPGAVQTQDIDGSLVTAYIGEGDNSGFMAPLADGLAASFHSNLFRHYIDKEGVQFTIEALLTRAFFPTSMNTYTGTTSFASGNNASYEVPTIVGDGASVAVSGDNGFSHVFPAGWNMEHLTFLTPQIQVKQVVNTDFLIRFIALPLSDDLGDVTFIGGGIAHHIDPYIHLENVKISIGGTYHRLSIGEWLSSNIFFGQALIEKTGSFWSLSMNGGYQFGGFDIDYRDEENRIQPAEINIENPFRLGLGGALHWGPVHLSISSSGFKPWILSSSIGLNF